MHPLVKYNTKKRLKCITNNSDNLGQAHARAAVRAATVVAAIYKGRTESHEQLFFECELGTADEGECGDRWNQLLCYP